MQRQRYQHRDISYWYWKDPKYSMDATSMITNLSEREVLAFICFRTLLKIHSCHNFPGFVCGAGVKVGAGVDKKYWRVFHTILDLRCAQGWETPDYICFQEVRRSETHNISEVIENDLSVRKCEKAEVQSAGWGQGWLLHRTPRRPKPKKLFNESKVMAAAIYLHKTEHFLQRKWKKVSQGCCIAAGRRPQRRKLFRAHRWLAINGDLESVTASIFLFPGFLKCLGVMFLSLCLCFYRVLIIVSLSMLNCYDIFLCLCFCLVCVLPST